jgi:tetratricopeptide (TPR) repeat protein
VPRQPRLLLLASLLLAAPALAQQGAPAKAPAPAASQPQSAPAASQPQSAPASQLALRLVADADGVIAVTPQGREAWRVRHAALRARPGERLVGPVTVSGRTLYAVRADLLEVDLARGVVARRTRFPAAIVALAPAGAAPADPRLQVTVEYHPPAAGAASRPAAATQPAAAGRVAFPHRIGDLAPGRSFWEPRDWLGAWTDARELVPELKPDHADPAKLEPETREKAIRALRDAAAHDPTNPHYLALAGVLLQAENQKAEAGRAFAAAAEAPGAHWADLLRAASTLEDAGAREPARRAFARGVRGLEAAGVRPERLRAAVAVTTLMPPPRRALAEALKAKDAARVDEIVARAARVFPAGEGTAPAWARLAAWLRDQGKADLAARWDERARHGGHAFGASPRRDLATEVDSRLPFLLGALLGTALIALAVGLRRGGTTSTQDGPLARIPVPRLADLAMILAPLAVALLLDLGTGDRLATIDRYASAPVGLLVDAADAPDVERWVSARVEPGPARTLLVAWVAQESEATRAGGRSVAPPLDGDACHEALEHPGTFGTQLRRTLAGTVTALATRITAMGGKPAELSSFRGVSVAALAALALFVVGFLLARLFPLAQALSWLIPGGARALSIPAGLVTALAAAGLCGNAYPAVLSSLVVPQAYRLHGLESIASADGGVGSTAPAWVFGALGVALALHAWGVIRDVKISRANRKAAAASRARD